MGLGSWQSPAFAGRSRKSYGGLVDSPFDPFAEEDGFIPGKGRKRTRFSMHNSDWRLIDEPESPGEKNVPADWAWIFDEEAISDNEEQSTGESDRKSVETAQVQTKPELEAELQANNDADLDTVMEDGPLVVSEGREHQVDRQEEDTHAHEVPATIDQHVGSFHLFHEARRSGFVAHQPTDTPHLYPIPSPGLPIPSPLVTTSNNSLGYFASIAAGVQPQSQRSVAPGSEIKAPENNDLSGAVTEALPHAVDDHLNIPPTFASTKATSVSVSQTIDSAATSTSDAFVEQNEVVQETANDIEDGESSSSFVESSVEAAETRLDDASQRGSLAEDEEDSEVYDEDELEGSEEEPQVEASEDEELQDDVRESESELESENKDHAEDSSPEHLPAGSAHGISEYSKNTHAPQSATEIESERRTRSPVAITGLSTGESGYPVQDIQSRDGLRQYDEYDDSESEDKGGEDDEDDEEDDEDEEAGLFDEDAEDESDEYDEESGEMVEYDSESDGMSREDLGQQQQKPTHKPAQTEVIVLDSDSEDEPAPSYFPEVRKQEQPIPDTDRLRSPRRSEDEGSNSDEMPYDVETGESSEIEESSEAEEEEAPGSDVEAGSEIKDIEVGYEDEEEDDDDDDDEEEEEDRMIEAEEEDQSEGEQLQTDGIGHEGAEHAEVKESMDDDAREVSQPGAAQEDTRQEDTQQVFIQREDVKGEDIQPKDIQPEDIRQEDISNIQQDESRQEEPQVEGIREESIQAESVQEENIREEQVQQEQLEDVQQESAQKNILDEDVEGAKTQGQASKDEYMETAKFQVDQELERSRTSMSPQAPSNLDGQGPEPLDVLNRAEDTKSLQSPEPTFFDANSGILPITQQHYPAYPSSAPDNFGLAIDPALEGLEPVQGTMDVDAVHHDYHEYQDAPSHEENHVGDSTRQHDNAVLPVNGSTSEPNHPDFPSKSPDHSKTQMPLTPELSQLSKPDAQLSMELSADAIPPTPDHTQKSAPPIETLPHEPPLHQESTEVKVEDPESSALVHDVEVPTQDEVDTYHSPREHQSPDTDSHDEYESVHSLDSVDLVDMNRNTPRHHRKRAHFASLATLVDHDNTLTDTISIATEVYPVTRATSGTKDFLLVLQLTDPSMAGTTLQAHIFRPQQEALPSVADGDAILLESFRPQHFHHSVTLVNTDTSSWAVLKSTDGTQVNAPPVDSTSDRMRYATKLHKWYREIGMAMVADNQLQASIGQASREETPESNVAFSDQGSVCSPSREFRSTSSSLSQRSSRRRKSHRRITIHELRDGRMYTEVGSPSGRGSIHELRDGTVYANL